MLGQEKLEDDAKKVAELLFNISQKRLALLEVAAERRAAKGEDTQPLQAQITELRTNVNAVLAAKAAAQKSRPATLSVIQ